MRDYLQEHLTTAVEKARIESWSFARIDIVNPETYAVFLTSQIPQPLFIQGTMDFWSGRVAGAWASPISMEHGGVSGAGVVKAFNSLREALCSPVLSGSRLPSVNEGAIEEPFAGLLRTEPEDWHLSAIRLDEDGRNAHVRLGATVADTPSSTMGVIWNLVIDPLSGVVSQASVRLDNAVGSDPTLEGEAAVALFMKLRDVIETRRNCREMKLSFEDFSLP